MSAYDRKKPFVPTLEDPGPVCFSEDGTSWSITRDIFLASPPGTIQAFVTEFAPAGTVLEPAVRSAGKLGAAD